MNFSYVIRFGGMKLKKALILSLLEAKKDAQKCNFRFLREKSWFHIFCLSIVLYDFLNNNSFSLWNLFIG